MVTIDRTWSDQENKIVDRVKGKQIRHVGLNQITLQTLPIKEGLIFTQPNGSPIFPNYVRKKLLPQACQKAGVKNIGPHGFRHTFASHYLMNGGSIWDLSKILGHSTIKLTNDYYGHFTREHVLKRAHVVSIGENLIEADFRRGAV